MSDVYDIANTERGAIALSKDDAQQLEPVNEVTESITKLWKDQAAVLAREDELEQVLTKKLIENVESGEMTKDDVMALWLNKHEADTNRITHMLTPYAGIVQEDIRSKTQQARDNGGVSGNGIGHQNNIQVNIKNGSQQDLGAALPGVDQSVMVGLQKLSEILAATSPASQTN